MKQEQSPLTRKGIEQIIPHRRPFMFLESVCEIDYGKRAVGELADLTEPDFDFLRSHFPDFQIDPGAILLEALAELGAIALLGSPENSGKIGVLAGIDKMRFKQMVKPEDKLQLEAEIIKTKLNMGKGHVKATLDGKTAVDGIIYFAIIDKPKEMSSI